MLQASPVGKWNCQDNNASLGATVLGIVAQRSPRALWYGGAVFLRPLVGKIELFLHLHRKKGNWPIHFAVFSGTFCGSSNGTASVMISKISRAVARIFTKLLLPSGPIMDGSHCIALKLVFVKYNDATRTKKITHTHTFFLPLSPPPSGSRRPHSPIRQCYLTSTYEKIQVLRYFSE
jgi:hypothetical protein